jgi:hypothetical protein
VLLSPKHASLRSSDVIRCISAGMIAPVSILTQKTYKPHAPTLTLPNSRGIWRLRVSPCRVGPAETIIHRRPLELTQHDNREVVRSGHEMLRKNNFPGRAHAKLGYLRVRTMDFELENVLTQPWLASRENQMAKRAGGCNTRTSQEVTHPSTTLAKVRYTAEF